MVRVGHVIIRLRPIGGLHRASVREALGDEARRRHHCARQTASRVADACGEDHKRRRREVNREGHVRRRRGREDARRGQLGYGMLLDRVRQRDVDGAPCQRVIPVAVNQFDDAVDIDGHDAPRRVLHAEDCPGGHLWTVGGFHGADLYALSSSHRIVSNDVNRHAAAAGRALDKKA